jgi:hypothetical protein
MLDTSKMSRPDFMADAGEMHPVCATLHQAAEIIETADRTPDEAVKKPLLDGARTMLQNVIDALDGRRTDGLVQPDGDDDE